MATQNRYYSNIATTTTLTSPGGINSGALQIQVGSTTGFPTQFPFILRIEPATTSEEVVLVTSGAGTSGSPYQVTRGYDGTAAIAHSQGVVVKHGFAQIDFQDPQIHLNLTGSTSGAHGLPATAWATPVFAKLSETTLATATANITFSSISQSYKHLRLYVYGAAASATVELDLLMQFNNDTGANYGWTQGYVNNTSATGSGGHTASTTSLKIGALWGANSTDIPGVSVIDIPLYSGTSFMKGYTAVSSSEDGNNVDWNITYAGGVWQNTAAINTITVFPGLSANFTAGTYAALYAIG